MTIKKQRNSFLWLIQKEDLGIVENTLYLIRMMQKIISIIKDPKVQIAVITGYIAPKILTLIGSKAYRLFSQKREQSRVFVGI